LNHEEHEGHEEEQAGILIGFFFVLFVFFVVQSFRIPTLPRWSICSSRHP
jgi:hypothetical protein